MSFFFRFPQILSRVLCICLVPSLFVACAQSRDEKWTVRSAVAESLRDRIFASRAAAIVSRMDDRTIAGQLLLTGVEGSHGLTARSAELLAEAGVGGVMLFKYNLGRGSEAARNLTDECVDAGSVVVNWGRSSDDAPSVAKGEYRYVIRPFIAVDHEGGSVHRFAQDATRLPPAAAFGASAAENGIRAAAETVEGAAYRAGLELRALGVTLNLAPVAEASDGRNAVFLGDRSYGRDWMIVAEAASAFVRGMDRAGVACVVKHFPGNTEADPHATASVISLDREGIGRMAAPFRRVMETSRPAAVMVSHAIVAALDADRPGSLSKKVIEGWLKGELGFKGFVVTDDLRMQAVAGGGRSPARAAVEAVAAGADLVMTWPADLVAVRDALTAAVASGELPAERLREAGRRIVAAKLRYGLCPRIDVGLETDSAVSASGKSTIADTIARFREETERYLEERGLR